MIFTMKNKKRHQKHSDGCRFCTHMTTIRMLLFAVNSTKQKSSVHKHVVSDVKRHQFYLFKNMILHFFFLLLKFIVAFSFCSRFNVFF